MEVEIIKAEGAVLGLYVGCLIEINGDFVA